MFEPHPSRIDPIVIALQQAEAQTARDHDVIAHLLDRQAVLVLRVRWLEAQLSHRTAPDQGEGGAI